MFLVIVSYHLKQKRLNERNTIKELEKIRL